MSLATRAAPDARWDSERLLDRALSAVRRKQDKAGRLGRFVLHEASLLLQCVRALRNEEVSRRAAALTYHTVLALVPLLAVAFALFEAFGGLQQIREPLQNLLVENLAPGRAEEIGRWLNRFIANINAGAIAGVGVLFLIYTATRLLTNIEEAINRVWNVEVTRPLHIRLAIYWTLLTVAPPVVALSISFSTNFIVAPARELFGPLGGDIVLMLSSPLMVALLFWVSYVAIPETKVPLKDAAAGALVAAVLWNLGKMGFLWLSKTSTRYNAIYGALSAIPLLMLWVYYSWLIVLVGVIYTRARHHAPELQAQEGLAVGAPTLRITARIAAALVVRFHEGKTITACQLASETGISEGTVARVLQLLQRHELVAESGTLERTTGTSEYFLRRDVGALKLSEIWELLHAPQSRDEEALPGHDAAFAAVSARIDSAEAAMLDRLDEPLAHVLAAALEPPQLSLGFAADESGAGHVALPDAQGRHEQGHRDRAQ